LIIGATTMVLLGTRLVNWRYLGVYVVVGVLVFGAAETLLNVTANVVRMLGKDPTLTDRTVVWADALALVENPILGAGFESFWLGERLDKLWAKWWWGPTQAHNGYIETYLNLGVVGVVLLIVLLLSTFQRVKNELMRSLEWGRFRMGYFVPILLYNYTEATFKGVHLVWLFFHFIAMDYPRFGRDRLVTIPKPAGGMDGKTGRTPSAAA
jgi:O-antigen ligase